MQTTENENETTATANVPTLTTGVTREVLPNGLTVLIKENHAAPVAALYLNAQVGYFNEPDRYNGIAHVIEHMLFKGTARRPEQEQIAREVRDLGGYINAGTYYEDTSYYITVPSQHLETAMDIQADLAQNSLLDGDELAKEIEVIVQESLIKRDNPSAMLTESLYALAYDAHRIRRWRIGHPETLREFRHDDLAIFLQDTYRPQNLVLAIVGDVNTADTLELARKFWANLPKGEFHREESPTETSRETFRYQRLLGETKQRLLLFHFPAPDTLHPDAAALMILSALMSDGRSARLYRKLKEELRIANSAWMSYEGFNTMGMMTVGAECVEDDPLPVEKALLAEIKRIQETAPDADELERIKTRVETRRLYAQEEVMGVARTLAGYETMGGYEMIDAFMQRLHDVTAQDVQRVARQYLRLPNAALLEYLPKETAETVPERSKEAMEAELTPLLAGAAAPLSRVNLLTATAPEVSEAKAIELPNGGTLYYKRRRDLPLVSLSVAFRGGKRHETSATCGLTNLMLKSSLKGTRQFGAEEIANRIEGLGSGIGFSASPDFFSYSMKLKRDVLAEGFAIFAEVLGHPTFPAEEVEREKQAIYAEIRRQQDNNVALAVDQFSAACYGDSPYGLPSAGIAESVAEQTPSTLAAWREGLMTTENMAIGIVGDLSEEEAIDLFDGLIAARSSRSFAPILSQYQSYSERIIARNKQQSAAVLGFRGASIYDDDRYALDMLAEIVSGMGGRFFRTVRGDNALAYQVSGFHRSRQDAGNFAAYASTAPENEQRAPRIAAGGMRVAGPRTGDGERIGFGESLHDWRTRHRDADLRGAGGRAGGLRHLWPRPRRTGAVFDAHRSDYGGGHSRGRREIPDARPLLAGRGAGRRGITFPEKRKTAKNPKDGAVRWRQTALIRVGEPTNFQSVLNALKWASQVF